MRGCKYRPIAKIIQHDLAKTALSRYFREGMSDCDALLSQAESLRSNIADTPFDRERLDNNADYIETFASNASRLIMPAAEMVFGEAEDARVNLSGVEVNPDVRFSLRRLTRNNKVKTGLATFRYAKGKALDPEVAAWQSSLLFGVRAGMDDDTDADPENALCLTIDAATATVHSAPTNALTRFRNMEAACQSIAERWGSIEPPDNAILA